MVEGGGQICERRIMQSSIEHVQFICWFVHLSNIDVGRGNDVFCVVRQNKIRSFLVTFGNEKHTKATFDEKHNCQIAYPSAYGQILTPLPHLIIRAFVHCPLDTGEEMSITHAKNKFPSPKTSSAYINVSYPFNVKIVHCWKPSKPTQKHCFFLFCFHSVPKGCRLYTNAQGQQPNMYEYKHYQFQGSHKYATIRCFTVTIRSSECAALACVVFLSFPPTDISWPFQNVIIICMCWSSLCM